MATLRPLVPGVLAIAFSCLIGNAAPAGAGEPIVLDGRQTAATFEGIGALSAGASSRLLIDYPEPQRGQILDFLFKPKYGASLQHLKVEIGGDVDSTDGTEPSIARTREEFLHPKPEYFQRGYEWWLMKEAKKRNPRIFFDILQWGAPGWIGNGKFYSQDNADFIAAFIHGAKKYHDLDISYCGIWNEKPYDTEWIKLLRKTLDKRGLEHVKIVAADELGKWTIADRMAEDAELRHAVQVIGKHYPHCRSTPLAQSLGKPLWANEDGPWSGNWAASRAGQCAGLPQTFNRNYVGGKLTKTIIWSPITSYYDVLPLPGSGLMRANQPWSGHYDVQPAVWMTAHTTQFIEPGWKYLGGSACGLLPGGGSHVTAVSPDGKSLSVVIETFGAKQVQPLSLKFAGGLAGRRLHAWRSTAREQFERLADFAVVDGTLSLEAEPEAIYSLTTTDGQQKAVTEIPTSRPLPLPYRDDFESYHVGATPKYLSDCFGAFEVKACGGHADTAERPAVGGKCLQQVITRRGIAWCGDGDPLTIIGSPTWRDYEVACDVCFDFHQAAWLHGRIKTVPEAAQPPQGYGLRIAGDGAWTLVENPSGRNLAAGKVEVAPRSWHRLALRMLGNRIAVVIDGKEAGSAVSDTFRSGLAGLGCGWEEVKFDNLAIEGK